MIVFYCGVYITNRKTSSRIGITRADAERAIQILNGEDHD